MVPGAVDSHRNLPFHTLTSLSAHVRRPPRRRPPATVLGLYYQARCPARYLTAPQMRCHPEIRTMVGTHRYARTGGREVCVFCPACDTRHPSTANFCMNCGIPLRESAAALRGE